MTILDKALAEADRAMFLDAVRALAVVYDIRDGRSVSGMVVAYAHDVQELPETAPTDRRSSTVADCAKQYVDWQCGKVIGGREAPKPWWCK